MASENESSESSDIALSYIGPGDKLKIMVYGEKQLSGLYQVSPEGAIMFPFAGNINVKGYTSFSLAERIAELLRQGYLKDPQVTVLVQEFVSKRIYVLGQVKQAGNFPMKEAMSIVEAISLAGGFTNFADISNVVVTRKIKGGQEKKYIINIEEVVNGDKKNFYLKPGDIIFVRERFF
jgi:polysaccharide export outer membrane protein